MNQQDIAKHEQVVYQKRDKIVSDYRQDPEKIISEIVRSVSSFLSVELDVVSFDKYKQSFEGDCQRAMGKIFSSIFSKQSPFLIFPDMVPGFTTLVYKKNPSFFCDETGVKAQKSLAVSKSAKQVKSSVSAPKKETLASSAVAHLLGSFFEKNPQMVLLIESSEMMMLFCPVADIAKYLKDLHVYSNL